MSRPWWQSLGRILWWTLTRVWAPLMALGWPVLVAYGMLEPRPQDLEALSAGRAQVALLVGVSSGGAECRSGADCSEHPARRSYIVLPRALSNAAVSVVENSASGPRATDHAGQAAVVVLTWLACLYATWRYWLRPFRPASNYALERTRDG